MKRSPGTRNPTTPLARTTLDIRILDLVAEYEMSHFFENQGREAIEAVFTFPVPLDAAFMGMDATLAGEDLTSTVTADTQACRDYDDAIAQGNSAVLIRTPEAGVVSVSLGNLMPGESGIIRLRFAAFLNVADQTVRFSLPLVHRPRYGEWDLDALETPTHDFAVEHPMSATIRVDGLLAGVPVHCGHPAGFARVGDGLVMSIDGAMLDRDLVLVFDLPEALPPSLRVVDDGDAALALATVVLPPQAQPPLPLDLCVVLDCSGSMTGDAITQSRRAVAAILDALGEQDRIQVLRFGSSVVPMLRRPLRASANVKRALRQMVPLIDADLGGTEMRAGLAKALEQLPAAEDGRSAVIIMVTDGAVQPRDIAAAQQAAMDVGVRIFVVAVGSSATTEVLQPLAEATGAVLERAVAAEPIDAAVMRQLRRARGRGAVTLEVAWPGLDSDPIALGPAYPGEAVCLAARLTGQPTGEVRVTAPSLGFTCGLAFAPPAASPALRSILGQARYRQAPRLEREAIALHYGLLTKETSAVLVKARNDATAADGLPLIIPIPQMVPAGMVCDVSVAFSHAAGSREPRDIAACMEPTGLSDIPDLPLWDRPFFLHAKGQQRHKPSPSTGSDMRRVLGEIFNLLAVSVRSGAGLVTLGEVVACLASEDQTQARELLAACGLSTDSLADSALLLLALMDVFEADDVGDEEEAALILAWFDHSPEPIRFDEASNAVLEHLCDALDATAEVQY